MVLRIIPTNIVKLVVVVIENAKITTPRVSTETPRVFTEIPCVFTKTPRVYTDSLQMFLL